MRRLLLVLLLTSLVFAQIQEPKLVNQLDSIITQGGIIRVTDGELYTVSLNSTFPQQTGYQSVQTANNFITDSEGNKLVTLSHDDPDNPFAYSLKSTVSTRARTTDSLPSSYGVPDEFLQFTRASDSVNSDTTGVKELAQEITRGSETDFGKIALLAIWVHNYIDYDLTLVGQRKESDWVLENKKGVCVEYASVFAALARSLGYPTRFVLGRAYGEYGWLGHAWNEVYIGEWVPVDATWLEVGHLDATHIEFFKSSESSAPQHVIAQVSDGASIQTEKPGFAGESDGVAIEIDEIHLSEESTNYQATLVAETLGFGESTLITLAVPGTDYRVIDARLVPCKSDAALLTIPDTDKSIVLEPGKTSYASWLVSVAPGLDSRIIYTCPITLNSRHLAETSISLSMQKASSTKGFTALISDSSVALGDMAQIFVTAPTGEKITVVGDGYYESRLSSGGATEFKFTPDHSGEHSLFVAIESGGAKEIKFTVEKGQKIFLKKVETPTRFFVGEAANIQVTVENVFDTPEKTVLEVTVAGLEQLTHLTVDESAEVNFTFTPSVPGDTVLEVELTGSGFSDSRVLPITVYEQPAVTVGTHSIEKVDGQVRVTVPVSSTNSVASVDVSLGGQPAELEGGEASFLMEPGLYVLSVEWTDNMGESHTDVKTINAVVKEKAGMSGLVTLVIAVVAALALFFLLFAAKKIVGEVQSNL
ncbi:transglutaminase domain-containing protein [archaeon]